MTVPNAQTRLSHLAVGGWAVNSGCRSEGKYGGGDDNDRCKFIDNIYHILVIMEML